MVQHHGAVVHVVLAQEPALELLEHARRSRGCAAGAGRASGRRARATGPRPSAATAASTSAARSPKGEPLALEGAVRLVEADVLEPAVEGALGGAHHGAVDGVRVVAGEGVEGAELALGVELRLARPCSAPRTRAARAAQPRCRAARKIDLAQVERARGAPAGASSSCLSARKRAATWASSATSSQARAEHVAACPRSARRSRTPSRQPGSCARKRRISSSASRRLAAGASRRGFDHRSSSWR